MSRGLTSCFTLQLRIRCSLFCLLLQTAFTASFTARDESSLRSKASQLGPPLASLIVSRAAPLSARWRQFEINPPKLPNTMSAALTRIVAESVYLPSGSVKNG